MIASPAWNWIARIEASDLGTGAFSEIYGDDSDLLERKRRLIVRVLQRFLSIFGDMPVRIFRAPGRINLRGMHVDTHGGYLNLMTDHREVIVVAALSNGEESHIANLDAGHDDVVTKPAMRDIAAMPWEAILDVPEVAARIDAQRDTWKNYVEGALLRAAHAFRDAPMCGIFAVVGSDLPQGASLSSSAALCTAVIQAAAGCNGRAFGEAGLIDAGRDAEWYTGARTGRSDQTAVVAGRRDYLLHVALREGMTTLSNAQYICWPEGLAVLSINSNTRRSLSGAQLLAYTLNRFAYSLGMEIFRQQAVKQGFPATEAAGISGLADITEDRLGGARRLYEILRTIPEQLPLADLRAAYTLPNLSAEYERYFGALGPEQRPILIPLRGPLLFGIAESARAESFARALTEGAHGRAGMLMATGHNGDRLFTSEGKPFARDAGNMLLEESAARAVPIEDIAGNYGASSRALDALVDQAMTAGAAGASLTGAGIAGTVVALCEREQVETIRERVRTFIGSAAYAALAGLPATISGTALEESAVVSQSVAAAGEIDFLQT